MYMMKCTKCSVNTKILLGTSVHGFNLLIKATLLEFDLFLIQKVDVKQPSEEQVQAAQNV